MLPALAMRCTYREGKGIGRAREREREGLTSTGDRGFVVRFLPSMKMEVKKEIKDNI